MTWFNELVQRALLALPVPARGRLFFAWRYRQGITPWDTGETPPEVVRWAENQEAGRMLDLGCGTGTNVLYLAERGWAATGVDFVAGAIEQAKRKRDRLGLEATFHRGDVTRLEALPLEPPYDLLLDIGCLHALPDEAGRARYAAQAVRLTRPGSTYLLYAALPGTQERPLGIEPERVEALFGPDFEIEEQTVGQAEGRPWRSAWYRLKRV